MSPIYLLSGNGFTGESFMSFEEIEQWMFDCLGRWPNAAEKRAIRSGKEIQIGSRYYKAERQELELAVA
jgi:hypothetical protein